MTHVTSCGYLNQQTDKPMAAADEMRASSHLKSGAEMEGLSPWEYLYTLHRQASSDECRTYCVRQQRTSAPPYCNQTGRTASVTYNRLVIRDVNARRMYNEPTSLCLHKHSCWSKLTNVIQFVSYNYSRGICITRRCEIRLRRQYARYKNDSEFTIRILILYLIKPAVTNSQDYSAHLPPVVKTVTPATTDKTNVVFDCKLVTRWQHTYCTKIFCYELYVPTVHE